MKGRATSKLGKIAHIATHPKYFSIYAKFRHFTMIPPYHYLINLAIAEAVKDTDGAVVECGVWRGGMIGGIAKLLGDDKEYFLYDSFAGLPPAQQIDGEAANAWQSDTESPLYLDNCAADEADAKQAMRLSGVSNYHIVKGWFQNTLPEFDATRKISILRLDGDWYDSTIECLENLYNKVSEDGVIIVDDYYDWDGCARAVHDYLSRNRVVARIGQYKGVVAYIAPEKNNKTPTSYGSIQSTVSSP